nr:MAG TPA: hypothetical protein [Caudoviricetes sp.]
MFPFVVNLFRFLPVKRPFEAEQALGRGHGADVYWWEWRFEVFVVHRFVSFPWDDLRLVFQILCQSGQTIRPHRSHVCMSIVVSSPRWHWNGFCASRSSPPPASAILVFLCIECHSPVWMVRFRMPSAMLFERSFESWRMMQRRPIRMDGSADRHLRSGTMTPTPSCAVLAAGVPWFAVRTVRAVFHPSDRIGVSSRVSVFGRDAFFDSNISSTRRAGIHACGSRSTLPVDNFASEGAGKPSIRAFPGSPCRCGGDVDFFSCIAAALGFWGRFLECWVALEPMRADDGRYVSASTISKGGNDDQESLEAEAAAARCRQRTLRQEEPRQEPSQDDGLRDTEEALTSRIDMTSAVVALQRHGRHSSSR